MIEGSLIDQICISKNVAMSCAAVENDTHPLKDMPNSFFAIDSSSLVAKQSQTDSD